MISLAARSRVLLSSLIGIALVFALVTDASAARRRYVRFAEFSNSNGYHGVGAEWDGIDWDIPCPDSAGFANRVNEFINVFGGIPPTADQRVWAQLGHQKVRYYQEACVSDNRFYWERQYLNSDGSLNYSFGVISGSGSGVSVALHRYALQRRTDGCASGKTWCWHFRIDDVTYHTCCGDQPELEKSPDVSSQLECIWDNSQTNCPTNGLVDPVGNNYTAKSAATGTWSSWAGRDGACVDAYANMRGKWIDGSDDDAKYGVNVSLSGGLTNACT